MSCAAGLSLTDRDAPVDAADLELRDPLRPSEAWRELVEESESFPSAFHRALESLSAEDSDPEKLELEGVTALNGIYAYYVHDAIVDEPPHFDAAVAPAVPDLIEATASMMGQTPLGPTGGREALRDGPLAVFEAADVAPTLGVRLTGEWAQASAEARERALSFVLDLARAFDVRLHAGRAVAGRLMRNHGDLLPARAVSEKPNAWPPRPDAVDDDAEVALAAAEDLEGDVGAWRLVEVLAETPTQSATFHELYNDVRLSDVSNAGVRKRAQRLREAGLAETPGQTTDGRVRLLPPALGALENHRQLQGDPGENTSEVSGSSGKLRGLTAVAESDPVSDPPKAHVGAVFTPRAGTGDPSPQGDGGGCRPGLSRPPATSYLSAARHHAPVAAAPSGGVAVVDAPMKKRAHPGDQGVSYNEDRGEVVVEVEWSGQVARTGVRLAVALASDKLLNQILDDVSLYGAAADHGLIEDWSTILLRDGRCLGWLPDSVQEDLNFRQLLRVARQELNEMSGKLTDADGNYNRGEASEVLRCAHGLIGTMTHLYDLLDIDVHRHIVIPEFSRNFGGVASQRAVAKFVATATAIGSKKGLYTAYRTLFEDRESKREDALGGPEVDPEDPMGELIGSWTISGPGVDELAPRLASLDEYLDLADDLEDDQRFAVDVPVRQGMRRETVASLLARLGKGKRMAPTSAAVSLYLAMLDNPHDVAHAFSLLEASPVEQRRVRLDEVAYGLGRIPASRVLPNVGSRGLSRMASSLLRSNRPLSTSELAEMASVSKQTIRAHRDRLEAFGLVDVQEGGAGRATTYRRRLPYRSERYDVADDAEPAERPDDQVPEFLAEASEDVLDAPTVVRRALERLGRDVDEREDLWDSLDPGGGAGGDLDTLFAWQEWLRGWADVVVALLGEEVGGRRSAEWWEGPFHLTAQLGEPPAPTTVQVTLTRAMANAD